MKVRAQFSQVRAFDEDADNLAIKNAEVNEIKAKVS
jgi:hypothetical protein